MKKGIALILVAVAAVFAGGCGTTYRTEYYLIGGRVTDAETKEPIPRAALYVAESESDFFKPPRIYADEIPSYEVDASKLIFGRDAASKYLFLMADEKGEFETVWRRDVVKHSFLPLLLFQSSKPETFAFAAGAQGYSDRVLTPGREQKEPGPFRASGDIADFKDKFNSVTIELNKGSENSVKPAPINAKLLKARQPRPPMGKAGKLFLEAEKAFGENNPTKALELYDQALAAEPEQALVWLFRLDTLYKLNRHQEVLEEGKRYIEKYPDVGFAYTILADSAHALWREDLNREYLVKAMQLDPEFRYGYKRVCAADMRYMQLPKGWLSASEVMK